MAVEATERAGARRPTQSLLYNPQLRQFIYQALTLIFIAWVIYYAWSNAAQNLAKANMTAGFGFLNGRAGFDIAQTPIAYSSDSTYSRALFIGLINTLIVAACGIVTATILGLLIGMGRLSNNWLISRLSTVYVEIFRNIPPLLVIFFWYKGVLALLPDVKKALSLPLSIYVSNRGVYMPAPVFSDGIGVVLIALAIGIVGAIIYARWASNKQMATGVRSPVLVVNLALIIGLPAVAMVATGFPVTFDVPVLGKFNMNGGTVVGPEFFSLYMALSFYTAAFISEIVRAGIRGVSSGQSEAAHALGIGSRLTTRLVVLPQALRIIIPPLTSQYLNITKNSSLAVAVGYADLVAVGGTILNQSGHSIEIIAIWMLVYVSISLMTSLFMNWFNAKMALVER